LVYRLGNLFFFNLKILRKLKTIIFTRHFQNHSSICWGAGHLVNINEVAGAFSGILFGISNTIATLPGIISPYMVGLITAQVNFKNKK
jgi:hypothetical protein